MTPQGPLIATAFTNGYHWEDSGHWRWEGFSSADEPITILAALWRHNLIGHPQALLGRLWFHPPTEYLFNSWTLVFFAVLISLQHNIQVYLLFVLTSRFHPLLHTSLLKLKKEAFVIFDKDTEDYYIFIFIIIIIL